MNTSDFLYELVRSMTKGDKRIFRQQSKIQSGNKDYVKLFDLLDKRKRPDDKVIMRRLEMDSEQSYYNLKNYLFRFLLKAMALNCDYPDGKVERNIAHIKILISKRQFGAAEKLLLRTLDKARKEERYLYCMELARLYVIVTRKQRCHRSGNILMEIQAYRRDTSVLLENWIEYEALMDDYYVFTQSFWTALNCTDREEILKLKDHLMLLSVDYALSPRAKRCFHGLNYAVGMVEGDFSTAYEHSGKLITLLEAHKHLRVDYFEEYYSAMVNSARLQLVFHQTDECAATISKLEGLKIPAGYVNKVVEIPFLILKLAYAVEVGDQNTGMEALGILVKRLEDKVLKICISDRLAGFFQIAVFFLAFGEPDKALIWSNKVKDEPGKMERSDLRCFARILNLYIAFDQGSDELLEHHSRAAYRYLYTRNLQYEYERRICRLIKSAFYKANHWDLKRFFREEIEALEYILESPFERRTSIYFDAVTWMRGKLEGKTIAEMNQERVRADSKLLRRTGTTIQNREYHSRLTKLHP